MGHRQFPKIPTPWDTAVEAWVEWSLASGRSDATVKLRRGHVRTMAGLSGTDHPEQLTPDAIAAIAAEQRWTFNYRCDMRTSLTDFYTWATESGTAAVSPVAAMPGDLIGSKVVKVRLSPEELAELERAADRRGVSVSEVTRELMRVGDGLWWFGHR